MAKLAAKVLQHAQQWCSTHASLTGQQQRMYAEVRALAEQDGVTAEDVADYPVAYRRPENPA